MTKKELAEYIDTYGRDIYAFCRHLTGGGQEADELYQDTWLKAVERLEGIDASGNVKSYCLSIALKLWGNKRRKAAWRGRIAGARDDSGEESLEALPDSSPTPEERCLEADRDAQVRRAVAELPDKLKAVVLLHYMEGLDISQTAKAAGVSAGTVKSRLYHARKFLKKKLEDDCNG